MKMTHIMAVITLLPGDVIPAGTSAGIGPLRAGNRVTIKVQGVGELTTQW
jgi:2-keto-4-pentenoate hydratase/2-oxohepta-3-ene-1,7-dioic acid hydratase in catechol pathway